VEGVFDDVGLSVTAGVSVTDAVGEFVVAAVGEAVGEAGDWLSPSEILISAQFQKVSG